MTDHLSTPGTQQAPALTITKNRHNAILLAAVVAAALTITLLTIAGRARPVPITPALLQRAAGQAEADGGGYDNVCEIYGAPRQLACTGQAGPTLMFIVTPNGQLQLEPATGQ